MPCRVCRPWSTLLLAAVLVALVAGPAAADFEYARGYAPPADWERILEERRMLFPPDKDPLPTFWDWRAHDGVTPAKDQGDCGSCWAFAAAGEMESKIRIYYGKLVDLSEQQIVSCNPYGSGCNGGWAGSAYYVFMHYGGVMERCMPYEADDHVPCTQDEYLKFTDMDTWVSIANDVDQIKTAVLNDGPVCTAVDANDAWDDYGGGVIDAPGSGTNHLVLIVGWDDRMGTEGAWIVKNSWGGSWGDGGYCYVAYGACNIGVATTAMIYTPPPVEVGVSSPLGDAVYFGDAPLTVSWYTQNEPVDAVDIYYGTDGNCQTELVAAGIPNTGSYEWVVPNTTTDRGTLVVFPSEGTHRGFGFNLGEFEIVGHQTRYVSADGGDIPPYDSPARAATSLAAAVLAGAGRDTILVAAGEYTESAITVNSPCHIIGGWNADFTEHDPAVHVTRLRGVNGTLRFGPDAGDYCGVQGITFHHCQASVGSVPVGGRHGAAIVAVNSSPVIEDCVFESNRADPGVATGWGGAILAHGGAPVIRGCEFAGNIGSHGGALALSACAGALVEDSVFRANATSDSTAAYAGGAIYVAGGQVTLRSIELRGGGSGVGGGLAVTAGAQVSGEDLVIVANRAQHGGAGVHASAGGATGGVLGLVRGEIVGNVLASGNGAGLNAGAVTLELAAVQIRDNTTIGLGGGLYTQELAGGALHNLLLHGNAAATGGGAFVLASGPVQVRNSVAVANTGGGLYLAGAATDADWNLAAGNVGADFISPMGPHDLAVDPGFVDAAAGDFAPALHSPLLDSGDAAAGEDWDGGRIDRGVHGGPHAAAAGPGRVTGLGGVQASGTVDLAWEALSDAATYAVYRDTAAVFVPGPQNLCGLVAAPQTSYQETLPAGDWYYVVGAVDGAGCAGGFSDRWETTGGGTPVGDGLPRVLAIRRVAPNPFNPRTVVQYAVPATGPVRLQVYDLRGRLVRTLHAGVLASGNHTATWDGTDAQGRAAAAGVYFVRLDDGHAASTVKAVLAK